MILKVLVLVAAVFVQANEVLSQYPQSQMNVAQMWDPSAWTQPYVEAASKFWMDYIKKAAEASQQLYQQWDNTGAADLWSTGMGIAQQMAVEAQKAAEAAMKQAQQAQSSAKGALN